MTTPSPALKVSFQPIVHLDTRVLVLGSMPGERSLASGQYYANPRNQFWRLVGCVIGSDLMVMGHEQRLAALQAAGIGLWDVFESAERDVSLDSAIRKGRVNDLADRARGLPSLTLIAFNGGKAAKHGRKVLGPNVYWKTVTLPSSSSARAISFESKLSDWMIIREHLGR